MKNFFKKIRLFYQALVALWQAWSIKNRRKLSNVQLPQALTSLDILNRGDIDYLIQCTDFLVRYGAIRTGRKCFFRAYILGSVLRQWCIPVILNVGLYDLAGKRKRHGHCWLTLDGQVFAESSAKSNLYTTRLGAGDNDIFYWYGN